MILDTNAISALEGRDERLIAAIEDLPVLILNIISLGEYRYGIDRSRYRSKLTIWLNALISKAEVLAPGLDTLPIYSQIRQQLKDAGTPIPANDVWIAAIALQHNMAIISQDAHFDKVTGINRVDW